MSNGQINVYTSIRGKGSGRRGRKRERKREGKRERGKEVARANHRFSWQRFCNAFFIEESQSFEEE